MNHTSTKDCIKTSLELYFKTTLGLSGNKETKFENNKKKYSAKSNSLREVKITRMFQLINISLALY
jgi:hypothetical protein